MVEMHPVRAAFSISMLLFVIVGLTVIEVLKAQGRTVGPWMTVTDWKVLGGLVLTMWTSNVYCGNSLPLPLMYLTFATARVFFRIP
jgi:hypothetical protein